VSPHHIGRSWAGTHIEDACSCPKESCGLVDSAKATCGQHTVRGGKTIRQSHAPKDCPGSRAPLEYEQLDYLVDEDPIALRDVAWAEIRRLRAERDEARARAKGIHLVCQEPEVRAERDSLAAQLERARPVLEAAEAWVTAPFGAYQSSPSEPQTSRTDDLANVQVKADSGHTYLSTACLHVRHVAVDIRGLPMSAEIPDEVYAEAARAYAVELAKPQPLGHWLADQPPLRAAIESAYAAGRASIHAEWAAKLAEDHVPDDMTVLEARAEALARQRVEVTVRAEVAAEIRAAASHWTRPSIAEWAARIAEGKTDTKEETKMSDIRASISEVIADSLERIAGRVIPPFEPEFLDVAQQIRLESVRLMLAHRRMHDPVVDQLIGEALKVASAIETGQVPAKTDTEEAK